MALKIIGLKRNQLSELTLVMNLMASFSASLCAEFSDSRFVTRPDESSFASLSKELISTKASFLN